MKQDVLPLLLNIVQKKQKRLIYEKMQQNVLSKLVKAVILGKKRIDQIKQVGDKHYNDQQASNNLIQNDDKHGFHLMKFEETNYNKEEWKRGEIFSSLAYNLEKGRKRADLRKELANAYKRVGLL